MRCALLRGEAIQWRLAFHGLLVREEGVGKPASLPPKAEEPLLAKYAEDAMRRQRRQKALFDLGFAGVAGGGPSVPGLLRSRLSPENTSIRALSGDKAEE